MSLPDELEKLQSLRNSGALTEDEFAAAKARLLGGGIQPLADGPTDDGPGPLAPLDRLRLSNTDKVIGGVCGGLAAWTGVPSLVWRIGFLVALLGYGFGILPYLILWICVPREAG